MNLFGKAILFLTLVLLLACATVIAPSGGPEDKLSPRVAAVYPSPNATNLPTELFLRIEFDEWIQSTLPRNAVSISPPLEKKLRYEISGDVLEITSRSVLDSNTTYTLTIGNSLKDLRGNPISPPFQMSFSTGKTIDSLFLAGQILLTPEMLKAKQLPSIALYPIGSERKKRNYLRKYLDSNQKEIDSLPALTKEIPLFFTQTDSTGRFKAIGLSPGRYRVLAFVDINGNRRLEFSDELASVYGDILLDSLFKDSLWLPLADLDNSPITLDSVKQNSNSVITPIFNRFVVPDTSTVCQLLSASKAPLDSLMPILNKEGQLSFALSKGLIEDSTYVLHCLQGKDSLGRTLDSVRNEVEFIWKDFPEDTLPPSIVATFPKSGSKFIFPEDSVILTYNKLQSHDTLDKELVFVSRKDTLPVMVSRLDGANFSVTSKQLLPYDAKVSLMQRYLDSTLALPDSLGKRDTLVEVKYRTLTSFEMVPKLRLASLKGKVPGGNDKVKVRIRSIESGKIKDVTCNPTGAFEFDLLLDGKYLLDYYYVDKWGNLEAGALEPLRFAKPWRTLSDTLILQPGENLLENMPPLPALN